MKKKALALLLASAMVVSMAACGDKENNGDSQSTATPAPSSNTAAPDNTPTSAPPDATQAPDVAANWDGAYMEADDFKAYISHDLELLVSDIQDQLTADQKTKVEAAKAAGLTAIEGAGTVAEVKKAYEDAYNAILACVPVANGLISVVSADYDERADMLGILETYGIRTGSTGVSLFESGVMQLFNPRVTTGTENYIVGYGFGTLAEGSITGDLEYETNPAWKRYYHSLSASDPGTLNYYNDQGSQVSDFFGYIAASFYTTFMNETKDGYEWVPELAMEKPVALNDDDKDGTATKWRFQVRTGAEGLKYSTNSKIPSRAAFNNREVALEDYETPFKMMLNQSNKLYRGAESAAQESGAIKGAKEFYNGTTNGFSQELWDKVGIKTYVEDGKSYFEVEFTQPLSQFYAMYYISSGLHMPVPQEFLDLVTVQNYLGFNNDATETPVDNSLVLGPWCLETYNQEQEVVFKKNPNYVYADTKYSIEGVHVKIFPAAASDNKAAFNEFLAGHTDAAAIPQAMMDEYRNDPRAKQTTGTSVFKLNANALNAEDWETLFGEDGSVTKTPKADYWEVKPVLGNTHFIQAMRYSIDRVSYANARGRIPSANYLSSNYMSNPEEGTPYIETEGHKKAVASQLEETDGYGYSLELARDYFRMALTELEAEGAYKPGTAENPTVITIEFAWQYPSDEEDSHNEIKAYIENAFNDPSVSGGKYKLVVNFWVGNNWSDVYYNKMMVGQFDLGMGSVSGNTLDPLSFMNVLSADQKISGGFTLSWGTDTNDPDAYPIVYKGERYSFDAFFRASTSQSIVTDGTNDQPVKYTYEKIKKQDDGSYTGSFDFTATLPELTKITVDKVVCCNYERARNGDQEYEEKEVEFKAEDKGNGVIHVTFTVPADLAKDYATGSGTSKTPAGITGFDFYYSYSLNGEESSGNYYSVEDNFVVE